MFDEFVEICYNSLYFVSNKIQNKDIEKNLKIARINYTLSEYIATALIFCMFISLFFSILFQNILVFLVSFIICFFISIQIPKKLAQNYQKQIEEELLSKLQIIVLELQMNIDFETIIEKHCSKTKLGKEFLLIHSKTKQGTALPEALGEFSESFDSEFITQVTSQLILIYNSGNQNLKSLQKILETKNKQNYLKLKEKNQKQGYYSILFVASSTVLPSMFQAYLIIGSSFLNLNYNETIWPAVICFLVINFLLLVKTCE